MKGADENRPTLNVEETTNPESGAKVNPPNWLGSYERASWEFLPEWRSTFQSEKSRITRQFIFYTLRTNGVAIGVSLIIAFSIWLIAPRIYFDVATLIPVGNISCATAAAISSIILFFVVFFFQRAGELEDQARNSVRHEIASLDLATDQISKWGGVQDNVTDSSVRAKAKHFIDASDKFYDAIRELIGLFSRAQKGTFYDIVKLDLLEKHSMVRGGDWYKACRELFDARETRDFAMGVWRDVRTSSNNLIRLNSDIQLAQDQYHKALQICFALPSFLIIVALALVAIFATNVLPAGFSITFLSIALISLLTTQILLLVRWACLLVSRETAARRANREADIKQSEKVTRLDTNEIIQDTLSFYEEASKGIEQMKKRVNKKKEGSS